jgi:hypothetical protein
MIDLIFRKNIFLLLLILLTVFVVIISYNRFIVNHDYIVYYEGECNPQSESCFIGCEDDECIEEYYYFEIEKNAHDLYEQCGNDFIDCDNAYLCLPTDQYCSVKYCDLEVDNECFSSNLDLFEAELEVMDGVDTEEVDILLENNN